jgi:GrpB-like predicted nucleotidyltransferase (UPF0157 family)
MDRPRPPPSEPDPASRDEPIRLVEHDPGWTDAFAREVERIEARCPTRFVEVRHIGSTAVPGLIAKPVIDLLAGLRVPDELEAATSELVALGYLHLPGSAAQSPDRRWLLRIEGGRRTHHLHLVVHGSRAWRERVAFREMLAHDAALRDRYAALKRELADRFAHDRDAYTAAKRPFIMEAVQRAIGDG